ncbi:MAG: hypothetical protein DRI57_31815 [Deltaproteobacteria bacterium]|nr:MAG: hypothetical protein DRI57_31815 [Deltaproteobacteria bacterium]
MVIAMNDWMPIFLMLCMLSILAVLWRILAVLKKISNSGIKITQDEKSVKRRSRWLFKKRQPSKKKAEKDMENRLGISFHLPTDRRIMMNIGEISADVLRKIGIDELEVGDIQVALDEVLANTIYSRLKEDPKRMVQLAIQCKADKIEMLIYEAETPFHRTDILKASSKKQAGELGITSAHRLMDKIEYETDRDGVKTLRMTKRMGKLSEKRKPLKSDEYLPDFDMDMDIEPSAASNAEMETFSLKSDEEFRKRPDEDEEELTLELNLSDKKEYKSESVPASDSEKPENLNLSNLSSLLDGMEEKSLSEKDAEEELEDFMLDLDFDLEPDDVEPVVETGKKSGVLTPDSDSILESDGKDHPPAARIEAEQDLEDLTLDPDFDLEIYDEEKYPEPESETEEDLESVTLELDPIQESENENPDPEAVTLVLDPVWESQDEAYLETEESFETLMPEPVLLPDSDDGAYAEAGIERKEEESEELMPELSLNLASDDEAYGGIEVQIEEESETLASDILVLESDGEEDEDGSDSEDEEELESFSLFDPDELLEIDKEPIAEKKTETENFVFDLALESEPDNEKHFNEKDIEGFEAELKLEAEIRQEREKKAENLLPDLNFDMDSPGKVLKKSGADTEADTTLNEMLAMLDGSEIEEPEKD